MSKILCSIVQQKKCVYLWTGWARPGMTENDTSVSTLWLKLLLTRVATGVGHEPRVKGGVNLLGAIALVSGRNALLRVSVTTFRTPPLKHLFFTASLNCDSEKNVNSKSEVLTTELTTVTINRSE
jgi:hypothetical protein